MIKEKIKDIEMTDIKADAIHCAKQNALLNDVEGVNIVQSNAFENLNETNFNLILSNPPYHVDFSLAKTFIEKGFNRLSIGGKFFMVTKRKEWYKNKFTSIFGGVKIYEQDGYYVFEAHKRDSKYSKKPIVKSKT